VKKTKKTIADATDEALRWSESNPTATKEEYEAKQKSLEEKVQPIMVKMYQQGGGGMPGMGGMGGMPGGFPQGGFPQGGDFPQPGNNTGGTGPSVDEVD